MHTVFQRFGAFWFYYLAQWMYLIILSKLFGAASLALEQSWDWVWQKVCQKTASVKPWINEIYWLIFIRLLHWLSQCQWCNTGEYRWRPPETDHNKTKCKWCPYAMDYNVVVSLPGHTFYIYKFILMQCNIYVDTYQSEWWCQVTRWMALFSESIIIMLSTQLGWDKLTILLQTAFWIYFQISLN